MDNTDSNSCATTIPDGNTLDRTGRGQRWLTNFRPEHQAVAALFARSFLLISRQQLEQGLASRIETSTRDMEGSVALFAVRELDPELKAEDIVVPPEPKAKGGPFIRINGSKVYVTKQAIRAFRKQELAPQPYFDLEDKTKRPSPVRVGPVGSEGPMANLIRDMCDRSGGSRLLDHPSLEEMTIQKTRHLVLVDDLVGSGTRIERFLWSLFRHKTLRSWYSYGLFQITLVTYAISSDRVDSVTSLGKISSVHYCQQVERGCAGWTAGEREAIETICRTYAPLTCKPGQPLGYKDTFTCLAFDYKCPNTAPAIIRGGSKTWYPLLRSRPSLDFPVWPAGETAIDHEKRILRALGQQRLATAELDKFVSQEGRQSLVLLAAVAQRKRKLGDLATALRLTRPECDQLIKRCQARHWLTAALRLTDEGHRELDYARRKQLLPGGGDIETCGVYYVPKSLRASRG